MRWWPYALAVNISIKYHGNFVVAFLIFAAIDKYQSSLTTSTTTRVVWCEGPSLFSIKTLHDVLHSTAYNSNPMGMCSLSFIDLLTLSRPSPKTRTCIHPQVQPRSRTLSGPPCKGT